MGCPLASLIWPTAANINYDGGYHYRSRLDFLEFDWKSYRYKRYFGAVFYLIQFRVSRDFLFGAAGCFRRFCRRIFPLIFVGKGPRKTLHENLWQNPPKFFTKKVPDTFLQRG